VNILLFLPTNIYQTS